MDELAVLLAVLDTGSLAEAGRRRSAAGHEPGHRGAGATCRRAADRADDLAAHGTPATPADLAGHATIVSVSRGGLLEWRFRDGERERVARLTPRLMVNDVEAMLLAARSGHGVARPLSYQVAGELEAGTLVRLLPAFEPAPEPVRLVFVCDGLMRPGV